LVEQEVDEAGDVMLILVVEWMEVEGEVEVVGVVGKSIVHVEM
jgi:hypothetical protein